jgi:hypothetical protein
MRYEHMVMQLHYHVKIFHIQVVTDRAYLPS